MKTREEIQGELFRSLDKKHVFTRKGRGGNVLSYVKAWHVIREANRIFGHDGWTSETILMERIIHRHFTKTYNGAEKKMFEVAYMAKVRITAGTASHEGTGTGNGIAADEYAAYEGAFKEAETDALKRALKNLGYPMGLALYDTDMAHVEDVEEKERREREEAAARDEHNALILRNANWIRKWLMKAESHDDLAELMRTERVVAWSNDAYHSHRELQEEIMELYATRQKALDDDPVPDGISPESAEKTLDGIHAAR